MFSDLMKYLTIKGNGRHIHFSFFFSLSTQTKYQRQRTTTLRPLQAGDQFEAHLLKLRPSLQPLEYPAAIFITSFGAYSNLEP